MHPKGRKKLLAENIALRQQLMSLTRNRTRAPDLFFSERFSFGLLAFFISPKRLKKISILLKPATILNYHRALVKSKYSILFRNKNPKKPGRKGPSQDLINVIIEMKRRNPRFGYLRITMQINKAFGLNLDFGVVRRVLNKHFKSDGPNDTGPSWLTFIGHMKDSLWSIDFFKCESINLKSHFVMLVLDQYTRRIIGFAVHDNYIDGVTMCLMFNKIISGKSLPKYLSSDHDPLFRFHQWQANLRVMDIEEIKTVPYTPTSHPFVERAIGTVRRDCLDQLFFWNKNDLEKKLSAYRLYYNEHRCHSSLSGDTPKEKCKNTNGDVIAMSDFKWKSHCRGLFQLPIAA